MGAKAGGYVRICVAKMKDWWLRCLRMFKMFLCLTNANVGIPNLIIVLASVVTKANVVLTECKHCTGFSALQMQLLSWKNPNRVLYWFLSYNFKCCPDRIQTLYWFLFYNCKCCPEWIQTMYWFLCLTNANVVLTESKHCTGFSALYMQMFSWQNPNIVLFSLPYNCKCCPDWIQTLHWFLRLTNANVVLTESKHCTGFSLKIANIVLTESKHCTGFSASQLQMFSWQNPITALVSLLQLQ